jgi:membrane dipeptidase
LAVALGSQWIACDDLEHRADDSLENRARRIHNRVLTLDTHVDIPAEFASESVDPGIRGTYKVDLPKMREGGLDGAFFIVYVRQTKERNQEAYDRAKADAMVKFNAIHRMTQVMYPDQIELAHSAADVERIHASGKRVAAIGIENGFVLGRDLSLVERYHALGARYITLAHGGHNDICDSATPRAWDGPSLHDGVSLFGEQVIAEMNRVGIMVDVSHISKSALLDAVRLSKAPVIASHSSVRVLADHPRNLDDEELLALQASGGVLQTVAFGGYIKIDPPEKTAARGALRESFGLGKEREIEELTPRERSDYEARWQAIDAAWPPADVEDLVDHIDYAVTLIGIDHVGISSDFDGGGIEGWSDASETLNVTLELVRRGYTEEQIRKLWSGNVLRVWRDTERVAGG